MHKHIYIYIYIQTYTYTNTHIYMCIYILMHTHIHIHIHIQIQIQIHIDRNIHIHMHMQICSFGFVQARNARLRSLLEPCKREMRAPRRFWSRAGAKCETLLAFAWIGRDPRNSRGFGVSQLESFIATPLKKKVRHTLEKRNPSAFHISN